MAIPIYVVDAFTAEPYAGNPAAVCMLTEEKTAHWMQRIAAEMNLSETAFLLPLAEEGYSLRWFTPKSEVDLCGHATLAAAHVLWETDLIRPNVEISFQTLSGIVKAARNGAWMSLDFPAEPPDAAICPVGLIEGLGIAEPVYVGKNRMDYLVEIAGEPELRALRPNYPMLKQLDGRGVIVTSQAGSSSGYDFVSRAFYPKLGVNEDPVTGSAHCCLAPYWKHKLGVEEQLAYQASERGGTLRIRMAGERVVMEGQAVTVLSGGLVHD